MYGRRAQTAAQYLQKGKRVLVTGRVSARAFMGNDGQPRASLEVTAQDFQFMSGRDEIDTDSATYGDSYGGGTPMATQNQPTANVQSQTVNQPTPAADTEDDFDDDDIPF